MMAVESGSTSPYPIPPVAVAAEVVFPAPSSFAHPLTIAIPGAAGAKYTGVSWVPKWKTEGSSVKFVLPAAATDTEPGSQCVAVFDDDGSPWVVGWLNQ